jgi:hypothetical protein
MAKAAIPGIGKGRNPNSLKNLNPIKPGEIRNPLGITRPRPYSDADLETSQEPVPELVRLKMNHVLRKMLENDSQGQKVVTVSKKEGDLIPPGMSWAAAISLRKHLRGLIECEIGILDHTRAGVEGTPTQRIEATGKDGEPLTPAVPPTFVYSFIDPPPKTEPPVAAPPPPESTEK